MGKSHVVFVPQAVAMEARGCVTGGGVTGMQVIGNVEIAGEVERESEAGLEGIEMGNGRA